MSIDRRPEFDAICDGWGGDGLDDLMARVQLMLEFWRANFPLLPAERKVASAMGARICSLGGINPVTIQ
jgi:hypothetical protein